MEQEGYIPMYEREGDDRPMYKQNEKPESAWLIERAIHGSPTWLCVECELFTWTADSLRAIRFCRREDAEQVAAVIGEDAERITEHQWG